MAERVRYVEGAVALLETCFLKLEEELEVELKMSVGLIRMRGLMVMSNRATWIPKSQGIMLL